MAMDIYFTRSVDGTRLDPYFSPSSRQNLMDVFLDYEPARSIYWTGETHNNSLVRPSILFFRHTRFRF